MKKTIIALIIIFAIILSALILPINITGKTIDKYSYTKAICNENNYCEDYYIECTNGNAKLTPTGFSIQHNPNWEDKRNTTKEYCK